MSIATPDKSSLPLPVDPTLLGAVLEAVNKGLTMCDASAKCVGISAVPSCDAPLVTGMIGVHGKVSGFITVSMSERVAITAVEGLLQEKYGALTSQVVDGVGEITNIIVGGIKGNLSSTPWAFGNMTVPSTIVGRGYQIAFARGLHFLCATFEHQNPEAVMLSDRLLQVSVCLLRL
jgi:chemotaxis protein CheX